MPTCPNHCRQGNSLVEYALPASLILLVSVGAWVGIASGFENKLGTVFDTPSNSQSSQASQPTMASGSNGNISSTNDVTNLGTQSANGPMMTGPSGLAVETAGSNGSATMIYQAATELDKLVMQAKFNNEDPILIDILTRLANQGHTLGGIIAKNDPANILADEQAVFSEIFDEYNNYRTLTLQSPISTSTSNAVYQQTNSSSSPMSSDYQVSSSTTAVKDAFLASTDSKISGSYNTINGEVQKSTVYKVKGQNNDAGAAVVNNASNDICAQGGQNCTQ
jgi:hypothetical protein